MPGSKFSHFGEDPGYAGNQGPAYSSVASSSLITSAGVPFPSQVTF